MCLLCCTYTYILCCEKGEDEAADFDSYEDISSSWWCSCCCGSKQFRANTQCGDDKCRLFLEQVKAKGVITYERFAYNRKFSPNLPLLHESSHNTKYLSVARPSMALSDVTERTEDSLSISLGCSYDMTNNYNHSNNDHSDYDYNNSNPSSTYDDPNSEFSNNYYDKNQILYPQREGEGDTLPESVVGDQGESCSSQSNSNLGNNSNNALMHKM